MSHVSFNRRSIAIIAILTMASSTVLAEEPLELGSYESYTTAVKQICYATDGENIPPWNSKVGTKQEIPKDLTKINLDFYPDMYDPNANEKFKKSLQAIKSDPDELQARVALESQNLPLASQIEKSSLVYKERMNNLYACAVLNAKYKINTRLTDQFKPAGTNIVRNLQQATQQIASQMSTRGCRNISAEE